MLRIGILNIIRSNSCLRRYASFESNFKLRRTIPRCIMRLIADGGSTKTDWGIVDEGRIILRIQTAGMNCSLQSEADMMKTLHEDLLPKLMSDESRQALDVDSISFYGSGVSAEREPRMCEILRQSFPNAVEIEAHSDLLGAARSLCGEKEGVACILGTGSNSCLYDGCRIVSNTPALGYILGDEGSGAVLGKMFINAMYKGVMPESLLTTFERETGLTLSDIIYKVYRQPMANRFLASLSPFIHAHIDIHEVRALVIDNFRQFFRRNITPYGRRDLKVNALGSIAYHYAEEFQAAAILEGFMVGDIIKSPFDSPYFTAY